MRPAQTLRSIEDETAIAEAVANDVVLIAEPSWITAALARCARRRADLRNVLENGTYTERDDAAQQIRGVKKVADFIGGAMPDVPAPRFAGKGRELDQHQLYLSKILCPDGWRDKIRPIFHTERQRAADELFEAAEGGDALADLSAYVRELDVFTRFLDKVEQNGERAAFAIQARLAKAS